jgi:hypothetical protein
MWFPPRYRATCTKLFLTMYSNLQNLFNFLFHNCPDLKLEFGNKIFFLLNKSTHVATICIFKKHVGNVRNKRIKNLIPI